MQDFIVSSGTERVAGPPALPSQSSISLLGHVKDHAHAPTRTPDFSQQTRGGSLSSLQSDGLSRVPRRGLLCLLTLTPREHVRKCRSSSSLLLSMCPARSSLPSLWSQAGPPHPGEMVLSLLRTQSPLWPFPVVCEPAW